MIISTYDRVNVLFLFSQKLIFAYKGYINTSQIILLHFSMPKTILHVNFGIITWLKICWFSNISRISLEWGSHIKSFNTLFKPIINYCRQFEDVKFNIFEDMTYWSRCIFWDTLFAKMCIFSTQNFLFTWKATLKSR